MAKRALGVFTLALFAAVFAAGCVKVSYPASGVPESIEKIAKDLYNINVIARVSGRTLGVLFYTPQLVDENNNVDQDFIRKTISDLVITSTRVALSTDLELESIVVAIRGEKDFNELRITRNIEDIKKAYTEALSVDESMNRTLWDQSKYRMDPVDPSYFPLKDIPLEAFIAKQVVQRLRLTATKPQAEGMLPNELVDGRFVPSPERVFEFSVVSFESQQPELNVIRILKTANQVLSGYEFNQFDKIVIKDLLSRKMLVVDRELLNEYKHKKVNETELIRRGFKDDYSETDRLRNAIEVFGLNQQ